MKLLKWYYKINWLFSTLHRNITTCVPFWLSKGSGDWWSRNGSNIPQKERHLLHFPWCSSWYSLGGKSPNGRQAGSPFYHWMWPMHIWHLKIYLQEKKNMLILFLYERFCITQFTNTVQTHMAHKQSFLIQCVSIWCPCLNCMVS